jgi:hypothetical protein
VTDLDAGLRSRRRGHKCVAEDAVHYDLLRGEKPADLPNPNQVISWWINLKTADWWGFTDPTPWLG